MFQLIDEKLFELLKKKEAKKFLLILSIVFLFFLLLLVSLLALSSQSSFCPTCHLIKEDYLSWKKSSHSQISCISCHHQRGYFSYLTFQLKKIKNLSSFLFNSYQKPLTTKVLNESCLSCHPAIIEISKESGKIKVSHKEFTNAGYLCTDCHSASFHPIKGRVRNYPNMDKCFQCHNGKNASAHCNLCHMEKISKKIKSSTKSPYLLTHGSADKKLHSMGNLETCSICHTVNFCSKCHRKTKMPHPAEWGYYHGIWGKQTSEDCYSCHSKKYCIKCHILPMPHPKEFLPSHGKIAVNIGFEICFRCHVIETCEFCHVKSVHRYIGGR